eukprot:5300236-Pleurochrysis_carterae.AAC.1
MCIRDRAVRALLRDALALAAARHGSGRHALWCAKQDARARVRARASVCVRADVCGRLQAWAFACASLPLAV